jgi:hypothetical protein
MIRVPGYSGENISLKLSDLRHGCFLTLGTEFCRSLASVGLVPRESFLPDFQSKLVCHNDSIGQRSSVS